MAHGFSVQGGLGAGGSAILHEFSDHSVLVPDAELLFTAQFHRAGPDLVLTGRDGQHHLIPGYFSSEHHPALVAPNGAHLSPDTVDLLAGSPMPGHYAQAQPIAPPDSIGKIEKVIGDVTVVRNGATVALHVGDAVFKSDVVQTGASASCGISFPDGTVLNLVANTRMALNDYAYDANSNANGALFTLVEGTFAFVAGKVAHSGDMKIATPVATMGIRGTTGVVEEQPNAPATITANAGDHTYTFAVVPDIGTGITGMWDVFLTDANGIIQRDANGNPIVLVTVSQSGYVTYLTPQGLGQPPLVSTEPATNSQYAFEQEMLHQLFLTLNPANLNGNGNNNGSSTTPPPFELPNPIPQLFEDSGKTFNINFPDGSNPTSPTTYDYVTGPTGPLTVVIWTASSPGVWSRGSNWLGGEQPTSPQEVEILTPIKVTADGNDSAAGLVIVSGATVNIVSGATLTIYDFIHGGGTIQLNSSGSDPTLAIHGAVSLVGGGTINMIGTAGEDNILGVPGTGALLINVDYTIEGTGTIGGGDGNLTFENFGTVNGNAGLLTIDTGNQVYNDGLMEATAGGTLAIEDSVANAGTVQADGAGSAVTLSGATFDNLFSVVAKNGGSVTFTNVAVSNEAGATISAENGAINFIGGAVANSGMIEAANGGFIGLQDVTVTNSASGQFQVDAGALVFFLGSVAILGGTITNAGVLGVGGTVTLNGAVLTNSGEINVAGSLLLEADTLTNESTGVIETFGAGTVDIEINNANTTNYGTIDAANNGTITIDINADGSKNYGLIEADSGTVIINSNGGGGGGDDGGGNYGTIEAINGGTVTINSGITNRAGATIEAIDPGSTIDFSEGETDNLGTIKADGTDAQVNFTNGMVDNSDLIVAENDGAISLASVLLTNEAGAVFEATQGGTIDYNTGGVTNDGIIEADHNGAITFEGQIGITNKSDGTIEALSGGSIVFKSSGVGSVSNDGGMIVASGGGTITFDATLNGAENIDGGIIEAGAGGTIIIDGFAGGNGLSNDGGFIEAIGAGAKVDLVGATIIGGTLETSGGGVIEAVNGTNTLLNVTFDGGILQVDSGATVDLSGGSSGIALVVDGTVTFQGGGTVELDFTSYKIVAGAGGGTLDNQTTIEGAGQIGNNDGLLALNNQAGGTIDADLSGQQIVLDTGNTVTNAGTLEAMNCGTLQVDDAVDNSGTIEALDCGTIVLAGGGSNSGTITATGGGAVTIDNDNNSSIFNSNMIQAGAGGTITINNTNDSGVWNSGTLEALTGGTLDIVDTNDNIKNTGTIEADGGTINITHDHSSVTNLNLVEAINGGTINITNVNNVSGGGNAGIEKADGGTINVHGGAANLSGGTLEAMNGGTFDIFSGGLSNASGGTVKAASGGTFTVSGGLSNASGGTIEALTGGSLNVDGGTVQNSGLIEALSCGIVTFDDGATIHNATGATIEALCGGTVDFDGVTVDNFGGIIAACGHDAVVNLSDATINGGTLETGDCGIIETVCGTSTLDGVTISDGTFIQANSGTFLDLEGTTTLNGTVTFEGGGTFVLDPGTASIVGGSGGGTLDIATGATLAGSGDIGNCGTTALALTNSGTIDANVSGKTLDIDTGQTVINAGTLEATNGGTLEIDDDIDNCRGTIAALTCGTINLKGSTVYNRNGSIEADGFGAAIMLAGAFIIGGTLETSAQGIIETVADSGNTTFDGVTIAACSNVQVSDDTTLTLQDTIDCNATVTNDGTITLAQGCHSSLIINGNITLAGSGTVVLSGDTDSIVGTGEGKNTLHNANTIEGSGTIGGDDLVFINQACGIVDADMCGHTLVLDTGTTVINLGLLEATNGGTLEIEDSVCNVGGTIAASGRGSVVDLDGATVTGGTLETSCGGLIETTGTSTLLNVTIADGSTLEAGTGATFLLEGTTTVSDPVTFKGGGTFELSGDHAKIVGSGDNAELHNYATIAGAGTIGNCALSVTNECSGVIDATGCLTIDLVPNTLTNYGLMEATGGGELTLLSTVSNFNVIAAYAGSTVYLDDTIFNSDCGQVIASGHCAVVDLFNATIRGGTIESDCGGLIQTVSGDGAPTTSTFDGVTIACDSDVKVADQTTLVLEDGTTMFAGRLSIACSGVVDVEQGGNDGCGGATLDGVKVTDNGALDIGDAGCGAILTLDDGTTITGHGSGTLTINFGNTLDVEKGKNYCDNGATLDGVTVQDNGAIDIGDVACGAILTLDDGTTITGGGTAALIINAGSTLDVENGPNGGGAALDDVHVTDNGALDIGDVACGAVLTLEDDATITGGGIGTLTIHANNTLDVEHGINGGATFDGINVIDNGAIDIGDVNSGAILTLDDGTTITGHGTGTLTINADNTLDVEHGSNFDSGGATLDGVHVTDNGAIDIGDAGCGAILTLDDGTTITGHGTGTLTINADNTLDVEHGGNDGCGGATLDGVNVTDNGAIDIGDVNSGAILTLDDGTTITGNSTGTLTIHADNTLDVEHGGNDGCGGATLDGVHVTDNGALDVGDAGSGAILTLDGCTTISGCGAMTINACNTLDVDGGTTTIDLGGTITNHGTLEASCGGELDVVSHVDNSSGMLEAKSGGKLDIESAISGGSATIQGGTLEFGGKSNVDVTFDHSHGYGQLTLDHAENFCGTITDFTGTCADSAHSDVIDLKDINFDSCGFHECYDAATGMLTVTDGTHTAYLKFEDFNGTFKFGSDGGSGTDIYDPPATGSKDAPSTTTATTTTTTTTSASSDHTAVPADKNESGNDHAVTSAPGTPPTLAENSFGASGNDSFTFHPNLGNDTAHDNGAQTTELAHSNGQVAAPALAPIAPEFHQEFAFDAIHLDAASIGAIVDQFHQMATNSTLLH